MNRIRELRERKGLNQTQLARLVPTSQQQIDRLETGERRLTDVWMKRIARALDVRAHELMASTEITDDDVIPVEGATPEVQAALVQSGFATYRVTNNSVECAGFPVGAVIICESKDDPSKIKSGEVVLVQIEQPDGNTVKVLRQYVAPGLVTTDRKGQNFADRIDGSNKMRLIGHVQ